MNKQIFGLALIGLMSAATAGTNLVLDMANFTEWGTDGGASFNDMTGKHQAYFVPDADVFSGGTSAVLAPDESLVGPCPKTDATCVANWNISKTQGSGVSVASKFKVTAFVPGSMMGWAWGMAGWWLLPSVNPSLSAPDAFGKSGTFGLDKMGTMVFDLSYTKDMPLTIQFRGEGIDENDANQSPPRYTYLGKGTRDAVSIKVTQVKRAAWSVPLSYDAKGVKGIGFIRMVAATSQGESFPTSEPVSTDFEFWTAQLPTNGVIELPFCRSFYSSLARLDLEPVACTPILDEPQPNTDLTEVSVYDIHGTLVKSGSQSMIRQGIPSGVYWLQQGEKVKSIVIE